MWDGQTVDIMCGMIWSDFEMEEFTTGTEQIPPDYACAISPYALREPENMRTIGPKQWRFVRRNSDLSLVNGGEFSYGGK